MIDLLKDQYRVHVGDEVSTFAFIDIPADSPEEANQIAESIDYGWVRDGAFWWLAVPAAMEPFVWGRPEPVRDSWVNNPTGAHRLSPMTLRSGETIALTFWADEEPN
jgi:hypothetical protein